MAPTDDPVYNMKFVKEIEKYPCIYNYKLTDYSRKNATDSAWEAVAQEMKDTVHNCKEKWRNLRTVFVRKLKPSFGQGGKEKKPYYLMNVMQFLLPYVRVNKPTDMQESLPSPSESANGGNENVATVNDNPLFNGNEENTPGQIRKPECIDVSAENSPQIPELNSTVESIASCSKRRKKCCSGTDDDRSFIEFVIMKKSKITSDADEEPRKQFLLSLLPDIKYITDAQMRRFKRKVLELVEEILDEAPDEPRMKIE